MKRELAAVALAAAALAVDAGVSAAAAHAAPAPQLRVRLWRTVVHEGVTGRDMLSMTAETNGCMHDVQAALSGGTDDTPRFETRLTNEVRVNGHVFTLTARFGRRDLTGTWYAQAWGVPCGQRDSAETEIMAVNMPAFSVRSGR